MSEPHYVDALVVGAGFGGIYATYRLARMSLTVKCIDVAGDIGGTWYWNRYPGAMSDTESYLYRYSWDKDDLRDYPWTHHYVYQHEILAYLKHVVQKHDLQKYMQFNTEMTAATWDDEAKLWRVSSSTREFVSRYLITSLGLLSKPNYPDIPGISNFGGKLVHTAKWDESLQLADRKVGIIGNGSTGTQVMTAVAPIVANLKLFQRHAQYSVPSGQAPIPAGYREEINKNYESIYERVWSSSTAFGVHESKRKTMEASPEERQKAFQEVWDQGNGFRFMFGAYGDLTTCRDANEEACKFIRSKIDEIVKDPQKAAILKPNDLYARRPLCDSGYYQIYNQENVEVVDLKRTPIEQIVRQGIQTTDGTIHELDVLIFATGFDAIEGNYLRLAITGRQGLTIQKHWESGPRAFGGIACPGFPNMFIVAGPQGPFANFVPVIESEINFIMSAIEFAERGNSVKDTPVGSESLDPSAKGTTVMEVSQQAEDDWLDLCDRLAEGSLFKETSSWIFGANIPGRKSTTRFYFGGLSQYLESADREIEGGFLSFQKSGQ
jgi:cation diffusion facilitator CzcD-associated flavoprotein CzcO